MPRAPAEILETQGQGQYESWDETARPEKRYRYRLVDEIKLAPDRMEIEIIYRVPEQFMDKVVAGALYVAIHEMLRPQLTRTVTLPRKGRQTRPLKAPETHRVGRSIPPPLPVPMMTRNGPQAQMPGAAFLGGG